METVPPVESGASIRTEPPRVRLGPPDASGPQPSRMPRGRSRRWNSVFDRAGQAPAVAVFFTQPAFVRVCSLAGRDLENEVGGALIGRWRIDPPSGEQYVVIEAVLPARHTRQGSAFLTFTQDTLLAFQEEQESRHPGKRIAGWFHTHPRMGVFFSDYDIWLHRHFFPEPWQVALVIEPHTQIGGFFIRGEDGRIDPHAYSGFHEILGRSGRSLVYWKNLEPAESGEPMEGAGNHE
ncbi:MAG: Mov34/MPN/PAD-1 family protein [Anaerolineales bacterium]|nr:Mov34/MPN/PAD-1 family protein [Anaerolineales bacterium]